MKNTKFLMVVLCIIFTCNIFCIPLVGATIEKEYEEEVYHETSKFYAFKVKLIIETETDGTWKTGSTYNLDFILIVTYFNNTHFQGDPLNFSAMEGEEGKFLYVEGDVGYLVGMYTPYTLIDSPTTKKMAEIRFNTQNEGRVKVYPLLTIRDIALHWGIWIDDYWGGYDVEPVYIDVKTPPIPSASLLIYIAVGLIVGVVIGASVVFVARRPKGSSFMSLSSAT